MGLSFKKIGRKLKGVQIGRILKGAATATVGFLSGQPQLIAAGSQQTLTATAGSFRRRAPRGGEADRGFVEAFFPGSPGATPPIEPQVIPPKGFDWVEAFKQIGQRGLDAVIGAAGERLSGTPAGQRAAQQQLESRTGAAILKFAQSPLVLVLGLLALFFMFGRRR